MKVFAAVLLLCVSVRADDGFSWSITDRPEFQWTITERGGDPESAPPAAVPSPGSGAVPSLTETAPEPSLTSICPCLGYKGRAFCYCLQRGVACRCNRTTGSEWVMENGRAVRKTGKYGNPNRVDHLAQNRPSTAPKSNGGNENTVSTPDSGYGVTAGSDGRYYWTDSTGTRWNDLGTGMHDGWVYGQRFVYRDGRMHENGSQMAANIVPKGHYENRRQCVNGVCRMYRVWVPE